MKKIVLVGGGGHCKCVIDAALSTGGFDIVGILDANKKVGDQVLGIPIIGTDSDLAKYFKKGINHCFVTAGSIADPALRIRLHQKIRTIGFKFPNIIHPSSTVSRSATMGAGNYLAAGSIVNAGTKIGSQCIINTGAVIDHDCSIGDFVHIAPGAALSGGVEIGDYCHIGTGSCVIQYLSIGPNTVVGAGSVVTKNMPDRIVCCGNPCREVKEK